MATFMTNIKFSQQGIKDIDHTRNQAAIFEAEAKKLGVKVKDRLAPVSARIFARLNARPSSNR